MSTTLKVVSGFVVGALAGVTAGLLFAPTSGQKTRKKIVKQFEHLRDDLAQDVEDKFDHLKEEYNEKLGQLTDLSKKGMDKLKEKVSVN